MSEVVKLNSLISQDNRVYRFAGEAAASFDYSDGEQTEQYLFDVLNSADDLSSRSQELQEKIVDWPSEYHLSSDRSNLLRGINLQGVKNVLEFGSGCGAISRYLGEQGVCVDAIEGSASRAELGRLRCRDLDNVSVINANYNDLEMPQNHYDLILFVGVIEYAQKFCPGESSDRSAAVTILRKVRSLLNQGGIVLVAIENRLGLKYMLGHHEDHYSKRYVGIHGYPGSPGIATYSENEWNQIIHESGYSSRVFSYPFPDYKIPRCVLGEEYAQTDLFAFNHLEGMVSRDYTRPATRSPTESISLQAASQGGFLPTIANSFLIAMGDSEPRLQEALAFDFCHMPGPGRKNRYAVVTRKNKGSNVVTKTPVEAESIGADPNISQVLEEQSYLTGNLLSTEWLRTILIYSRRDEFDVLIDRYYAFLGELESSGKNLKIDMLPINIVVDPDGEYRLFDQEWEVNWEITREYLLFRALLTFVVTNWVHMKDFLGWLELHTVRDFVDYGFRNHRLMLNQYLEKFIEIENRFQETITHPNDERQVEQLLNTVFDFSSDELNLYATMYLSENLSNPAEENGIEVMYSPSPESQTITFPLARGITAIRSLRLDPFDIRKTENTGFFSLSAISIVNVLDDEENEIWSLSGEQEIADKCNATSCWFEPLGETGFWMASTEFPKLVFCPPHPITLDPNATHTIQIQIRVCENAEYILAHHRYIVRLRQQEQLEADLRSTTHHLASARRELTDIKAGKPFRLGMKIFSLLGLIRNQG